MTYHSLHSYKKLSNQHELQKVQRRRKQKGNNSFSCSGYSGKYEHRRHDHKNSCSLKTKRTCRGNHTFDNLDSCVKYSISRNEIPTFPANPIQYPETPGPTKPYPETPGPTKPYPEIPEDVPYPMPQIPGEDVPYPMPQIPGEDVPYPMPEIPEDVPYPMPQIPGEDVPYPMPQIPGEEEEPRVRSYKCVKGFNMGVCVPSGLLPNGVSRFSDANKCAMACGGAVVTFN